MVLVGNGTQAKSMVKFLPWGAMKRDIGADFPVLTDINAFDHYRQRPRGPIIFGVHDR